jgi:hypothetical protein
MGGRDFLLAPRYGEMLNVVSMAFVFCATMPLLIPMVAIAVAAAYWAQLAELLYVSKRPTAQVPSTLGVFKILDCLKR